MDAYRRVPSGDFCEYYDMLVGPDGFECLLTEPEDRNWHRDGRVVIDRLNAQHAELTALRAEVERLREERRWIPVEERLPDRDEPVFLREKGGVQFIGCLSHDEVGECWCRADGEPWYAGDGWFCYADVGDYKPTHWHPFPQPLPAPPEEE